MPIIWPVSLPQSPLMDGYDETVAPNSVEVELEGYRNTRPKFSRVPTRASLGVMLTKTQFTTFKTFYETTLLYGNERFEWKLPTSAVTQEFKFLGPYRVQPAGIKFRVDMDFEVLPL